MTEINENCLTVQGRLTSKKSILLYQLLCCAVYFTSYITRINYAAAVSAIIADMGVAKQLAGLAVTGAFITYGLGQLVSGVLGDKFAPQKVITVGLICTSICNFLLPFMPSIYLMTAVWCFNGFFQSMLWPPLVRVMSHLFDEEGYKKACVYVTFASSSGTIVVYLLVSVCTAAVAGWRSAFYCTGAVGVGVSLLWLLCTRKLTLGAKQNTVPQEKSASIRTVFKAEHLLPVVIAIALQGMLRDGVTTWTPSYITEVFKLRASSSILTTVVLPLFSFVCIALAAAVNKRIKGEARCSVLFFGVAFAASVVLMLAFDLNAAFSVALMALITGCAHGINLMLVCNLPGSLTHYGRVSTVSGLLNTFTYVGSAISTFGFAALADSKGWYFTIGTWAVTALLGGALCALTMLLQRKDATAKA